MLCLKFNSLFPVFIKKKTGSYLHLVEMNKVGLFQKYCSSYKLYLCQGTRSEYLHPIVKMINFVKEVGAGLLKNCNHL